MSTGDLKALSAPAAVLFIVILVAAGAVYYTDGLLVQARRDLDRQEAMLKEARTRLYRSGEERDIIARYLGRYLDLQRVGFVGDEQRINWLDGLRIANEQADLFGVDYQISEQRAYPYAREFDPGQITLHRSVMKLRFRMVHEGDLMRFFGALARTGAGVFAIDECRLTRLDGSAALRYQPNLSAECELSWITARPPAAEKRS